MKSSMKASLTTEEKTLVQQWYEEMEKVRYDKKRLTTFYEDSALLYDRVWEIIGLHYAEVATEIEILFEGSTPSEKRILDLGAGTGLLGKELYRRGFCNVDGIDGSSAMLEVAESTNCYRRLYTERVTSGARSSVCQEAYDAVVATGCFTPGHFEIVELSEICRCLKPGGVIVCTLNDPDYSMRYLHGLGDLIESKLVTLISMRESPYKLDYRQDFRPSNAYLISLRLKGPEGA